MVDEIVKAQGKLEQTIEREPDMNFSDYQSETFQNAKVYNMSVTIVTIHIILPPSLSVLL